MKTLLKIATAVTFFIFLSSYGQAQDMKKCPWHKHGWHPNDSSQTEEFTCPMERFNMDGFPFHKHKHKFNGHWAGIELAVSGYVTPDFDMNFKAPYDFMNMNTARSLTVNMNPFDLNVNLYKNKIGFTTGLGLQVSNYYLTDNYVMIKDSSTLMAYKIEDSYGNPVDLKVNKMVITYLNLPLFFEYQTNPGLRLSSFHVTLGVIAGVRLGSYTKQVYEEKEGSYFLVDDAGKKIASFDVDHHTVRDHGAYHLSPFKLDAAFRVGWSYLNLFGTYSLTQMFQKNQGPELYPFTVGISLLGW